MKPERPFIIKFCKHLVNCKKRRWLAASWVIAHALNEVAVVVTKGEKVKALNSIKFKTPNVYNNMRVNKINDYVMVEQLVLNFCCSK